MPRKPINWKKNTFIDNQPNSAYFWYYFNDPKEKDSLETSLRGSLQRHGIQGKQLLSLKIENAIGMKREIYNQWRQSLEQPRAKQILKKTMQFIPVGNYYVYYPSQDYPYNKLVNLALSLNREAKKKGLMIDFQANEIQHAIFIDKISYHLWQQQLSNKEIEPFSLQDISESQIVESNELAMLDDSNIEQALEDFVFSNGQTFFAHSDFAKENNDKLKMNYDYEMLPGQNAARIVMTASQKAVIVASNLNEKLHRDRDMNKQFCNVDHLPLLYVTRHDQEVMVILNEKAVGNDQDKAALFKQLLLNFLAKPANKSKVNWDAVYFEISGDEAILRQDVYNHGKTLRDSFDSIIKNKKYGDEYYKSLLKMSTKQGFKISLLKSIDNLSAEESLLKLLKNLKRFNQNKIIVKAEAQSNNTFRN